MIHLSHKAYLLVPGESDSGARSVEGQSVGDVLSAAYRDRGRRRILASGEDFAKILLTHWRAILDDASRANIAELYSLADVDSRLKCLPELPPLTSEGSAGEDAERANLRVPDPRDLSFEFVLASYFRWPELVWPTMQQKLEYFCWEQIIQEISVIRQEANLLIFNRKINSFLPKEFQIDHNEDIEIQLYGNPYLNWLFDEEYRFSNVEHFKKHVNLEMVTHFYDSWMMARRRGTFNEEPDQSMDNLRWITGAIAAGDWKMLLDSNLKRNFGCVYLDNTMIPKANQVLASALYRDFARQDFSNARKFSLKQELFERDLSPVKAAATKPLHP
jgi:hypothetical protein